MLLQHMMPGMAPPGPPGAYMPGPYMQPIPYPPGMPPPNGMFIAFQDVLMDSCTLTVAMYNPGMGQMPRMPLFMFELQMHSYFSRKRRKLTCRPHTMAHIRLLMVQVLDPRCRLLQFHLTLTHTITVPKVRHGFLCG